MHRKMTLILTTMFLAACTSSNSSLSLSSSLPLSISSVNEISSLSLSSLITSSSSESSCVSISSSEYSSSSSSSSTWMLYETNFSSLEGFALAEISENYRNFGPVGQRWGIENGGIVDAGDVDGSQAIVLRFDPNRTHIYTTLGMGFTVNNPGLLHFEAHSTFEGIELRLGYYFQDEFSVHWLSAFSLYEGNATYELNLDLIGDVKLYWMVLVPDPLPPAIVYITIDRLKIYPIVEEVE